MSLNPNSLSTDLIELITRVSAINEDGSPKPANIKPRGDFASEFASCYNRYASQGVVPGAENTGGDTSMLVNLLTTARENESSVDIDAFALAFADYWSTVAVDPAGPAHGGNSVSGVVNNAMAHVGDFKRAIAESLTTEEKRPWYLHFIVNLEEMAVKKIIWTVTEVFPAGASDFEENIT